MSEGDTGEDVNRNLFLQLESGEEKKDILLKWITESLASNSLNAIAILDDLERFLKHLITVDEEDSSQYGSKVLIYQASCLSILCLKDVSVENPGIVHRFGQVLVNVFCEKWDDVVDDEVLKKKLKKRKPTHIYSVGKDYAVVMLCHIYATFNSELGSLSDNVLLALFKNLKKTLDKEKYFNSGYAISVMRLYQSIYVATSSEIADEFSAKFFKFAKHSFTEFTVDGIDYPLELVCSLLESLPSYFCSRTFIKSSVPDLLGALESKLHIFFSPSFKKSKLRLSLARSLADILFFFVRNGHTSILDAVRFYGTLFDRFKKKSDKLGLLESFHQFVSVSMSADSEVLLGSRYLTLLSTFVNSRTEGAETSIFMDIELLSAFHSQILPFVSDSSRAAIISTMFENPDVFLSKAEKPKTLIYLAFLLSLVADLPSKLRFDDEALSKIYSVLSDVAKFDNDSIQVYSVNCLRSLIISIPQKVGSYVDVLMEKLTSIFSNGESSIFDEAHWLASLVSSVVSTAEVEVISVDAVMRITTFSIGELKKNCLSLKGNLHDKELICWLLLTGTLSLDNANYIKMHSAQLFIFWRNILTHNYSYQSEAELHKNLQTRIYSLTCMISFLRSSFITDEMAKQVFYLMTKCLNFYHSVIEDDVITSELKLKYEYRVYQIFLLICPSVHKEISSSVLIQIVRKFSQPRYGSLNSMDSVFNLKSLKEALNESSPDRFYDVLISNESEVFGLSSIVKPCWDSSSMSSILLEKEYLSPVSCSRSYDFSSTILGLSVPAPIATGVVDASIELFSLCFPYSSPTVQRSLLEHLSTNLLTSRQYNFKYCVVKSNVLFALSLALTEVEKGRLPLNSVICELFIVLLEECAFDDDDLLFSMKGKCYGYLASAAKRSGADKFGADVINQSVSKIVGNDDALCRGMNLSVICHVYRMDSSSIHVSLVLDIIEKFILDPHPIIHCVGLKSLSILMEDMKIIDVNNVAHIINLLYAVFLDNSFGPYSVLSGSHDYYQFFNSEVLTANVLLVLLQLIGPEVRTLSSPLQTKLKCLVCAFNMSPCVDVRSMSVKICELLCVLKCDGVFSLKLVLNIVRAECFAMIRQNVSSGYLGAVVHGERNEFCSVESFNIALQFLCELGRLQVCEIFEDPILSRGLCGILSVFPKFRWLRVFLKSWCLYHLKKDDSMLGRVVAMFDKPLSAYLKPVLSYGNMEVGKDCRSPKGLWSDNEGPIVEVGLYDTLGPLYFQFLLELLECCLVEMSDDVVEENARKYLGKMLTFCYNGCSSGIPSVQLSSLNLIRRVMIRFGRIVDGEAGSNELMIEQHVAILSSTVLLLIDKGSHPKVRSECLSVCAEIISEGLVPLLVSNPVVNVMVDALLQLAENKILMGWAILFKNKNEELEKFVKEYLNVLVPLWIISQDFDLEGFVFVMFGEILQ